MITDTRSLLGKGIEYSMYAFFVVFPFILYPSFLYNGTSTRSLNLIVFSGVLAIVFGAWLYTRRATLSIARSPILIAGFAYFAVLWLSAFAGLSFSNSYWSVATRMTGLWYLTALAIFALLLWTVISDTKRHHRLILTIIVSTGLFSVLDLLSSDGLGILGDATWDAFTFGNSSFAAMYLFGALLLSIYYLLQAQRRRWWMYILPLLLLINPNIINPLVWQGNFINVWGEARATAYLIPLSLFALGGMWFISKLPSRISRVRASYALFAVGVVAVIFAAFSLLMPDGYVRQLYLKQGTAVRPIAWEMSQKAIAERPFLGWGTDNFERVFEKHYDNRLLQSEYGNEAWLDRAHNIFIDQLVDNGIVGLLAYAALYVVTILALIRTLLSAEEKRDRLLAAVLIVYFTLHIAELQTAFETSISYPMLVFMFISSAVLCHRTGAQTHVTYDLSRTARYVFGGVLIVFSLWSLIWGAIPLANAQVANGAIRRVGSSERRLPLYPALFGSSVDQHAFLWRTSTDFQRGIAEDPSVFEDKATVESLKKELAVFESEYRAYVEKHPEHFRAYLNLADVLIYQRLFGIDKLDEAQSLLDRAIEMVPQSPQPYWMKAVAYIYMHEFEKAKEYAQKGLALNPAIVQSQDIVKYVDESIRNYPEIDLFFFRQI